MAAPDLSCGMRDLPSSLRHARSLLWRVGSSSGDVQWKHGVLATRSPGKSQTNAFIKNIGLAKSSLGWKNLNELFGQPNIFQE